jgi:hypothetical protein
VPWPAVGRLGGHGGTSSPASAAVGVNRSLTISSPVARTRLHTAHQAPELTEPVSTFSERPVSIISHRPVKWGRMWNSPFGALGRLNTHATGAGTQPCGSQKTGCLRYHHTRTSWTPVVRTQRREEKRKQKDDLADPRSPSEVNYVSYLIRIRQKRWG